MRSFKLINKNIKRNKSKKKKWGLCGDSTEDKMKKTKKIHEARSRFKIWLRVEKLNYKIRTNRVGLRTVVVWTPNYLTTCFKGRKPRYLN